VTNFEGEFTCIPEIAEIEGGKKVEISFEKELPQITEYDEEEKCYKIKIGPQTEVIRKAYLKMIMRRNILASMYLESIPGEQKLELHFRTPIKLPKGAEVINKEELEKVSRCKIVFGNGGYMETFVEVDEKEDGESIVSLYEEIVIPEKSLPVCVLMSEEEDSNEEEGEPLISYKECTIKFKLPAAEAEEIEYIEVDQGVIDVEEWEKRWARRFSRTFTKVFTFRAPPPWWLRGDGKIKLTATPSVYLEAYLGFDLRLRWVCVKRTCVKWWWFGWRKSCWCWWAPRMKLVWFQTYVKANPELLSKLNAYAHGRMYKRIATEINIGQHRFYTCIGSWPAWINLKATAVPNASIWASVRDFNFDAQSRIWSRNKLGVKWYRRWHRICEHRRGASARILKATVKGSAQVRPGVGFILAGYVYDIAGPYVKVEPYIKAGVRGWYPNPDCRYYVRCGISAGGGFRSAGWLRNLLRGLGSYYTNFYSQEWTLKTGRCRR
jgi:hypothetical protein